jgi:hypothetical protein
VATSRDQENLAVTGLHLAVISHDHLTKDVPVIRDALKVSLVIVLAIAHRLRVKKNRVKKKGRDFILCPFSF